MMKGGQIIQIQFPTNLNKHSSSTNKYECICVHMCVCVNGITGSAVETLFAQYKYLSGNKVDAVNYTTARSKYICKEKVEATHHSRMYYRDIPLNIPSAPLEKKKYDRHKKEDS